MGALSVQAATLANVASSATNVTVFAAAGGTRARAVVNDSSAILYLKFGATASTTSYSARSNGVSFTVTSGNAADTSVVGWLIVEPT